MEPRLVDCADQLDPRVIDAYERGETIAPTLERLGRKRLSELVLQERIEKAVLGLLQDPEGQKQAA